MDANAEIARLKEQSGKDMIIFGSSDLAETLKPERPINEYRIMVNPIVLGKGKPCSQGYKISSI
jgi:dihydrofolate reductase